MSAILRRALTNLLAAIRDFEAMRRREAQNYRDDPPCWTRDWEGGE